jgi:gluconolactonase
VLTLLITAVFAADAPPEKHPVPETVAAGAELKEVYAAPRWFEGPSWDAATKRFYFSSYTKENQQLLRLDEVGKVTVWMDKTQDINGTCITRAGRMLCAQTNTHSVLSVKVGASGPEDIKVLYHDEALNQPNDVREAPNGNVYFSDPDFNTKKKSAVYLIRPDGKTSKIITDMTLPNGLIVSLDGKTLIVSDSADKIWRAYPIKEDGSVGDGKLFFDPKTDDKRDPDGMTLDEKGNVYCTGRGGVWVTDPNGKELGLIAVKDLTSNCTFGGEDGKTLFITGGNKVWTMQMIVRGAPILKD